MHKGRGELFPLLFCAVGLQHVCEEAAADLRELYAVGGEGLDPVLVVLEGQIQDEPSGVGEILFEFTIDQF